MTPTATKAAIKDASPPRTDEQARAIGTRDVSIALSAGAGCGKTFVLTERFLDYFDPGRPGHLRPDDVGRLVAITFTERAAREMRDRIRQKCQERLIEADAAHAPYWAALARELDAARISTIHSFCASLLRSRAVEAGVDPRFEVLEQAQAETLRSEAIADALRRLIAAHDESALDLAAQFGLERLAGMLRELVAEGWDDASEAWLDVSPQRQVEIWQRYHRRNVLPEVIRELVESPAAKILQRALAEGVPGNAKMKARERALAATFARLAEGQLNGPALADCLAAIDENARVERDTTAKQWDRAEAFAAFRDAAADLRKKAGKLAGAVPFDAEAALLPAAVGRRVLEVAAGAAREYERIKAGLAVLDFGDLLVRTRRLLTAPNHAQLAARLSDQIELVLVDEFQDTDPLQVELVRALAGGGIAGGKLFFVGDYKQSIYRFRGADPDVFRRLRQETPTRGQQSLTRNFRSQPAVLEFVNALFWHDLGDHYEALRPQRPQSTPKPCVEFLWAVGPETAEAGREKKDTARRREADWIARRIRGLLDGGQRVVCEASSSSDKPAARAAQPRDIAILMRALSDVAYYEDALRRRGIDYYLVGGHAFYAQQEIFDVVNLLRTLNSPSDLVSLVGVLRSGFFGLADETIFWLAQHRAGLAGGLLAQRLPAEIGPEQARQAQLRGGDACRAAGAQEPVADLRLDRRGVGTHGLRRGASERVLGRAEAGQPAKARRAGARFPAGRFFGPWRLHRRAVGVRGGSAR